MSLTINACWLDLKDNYYILEILHKSLFIVLSNFLKKELHSLVRFTFQQSGVYLLLL